MTPRELKAIPGGGERDDTGQQRPTGVNSWAYCEQHLSGGHLDAPEFLPCGGQRGYDRRGAFGLVLRDPAEALS